MKHLICGLLVLAVFSTSLSAQESLPISSRDMELVIVVGAHGSEEYGRRFTESVQAWEKACAKAGARCTVIGAGLEGGGDAVVLKERLSHQRTRASGSLWLVLIGHGTFDGRDAKFNLRGPDLSADQLGEWLKPLKQEIVFVHTGSASSPFLKSITGPGRICVSATKSPDEVFYARFGEFFSVAIGGLPEADIDQDKQVSILEAFLHASKQVAQFYETEERLATEHAILDDNGDGVGTRSEIFVGVKPVNAPAGLAVDGDRARQVCLVLNAEEMRLSEETRRLRDALEREVQVLSAKKSSMHEADYYAAMEPLLVKLSRLYTHPQQ